MAGAAKASGGKTMMGTLVYTANWRCIFCGAAGAVSIPFSECCDVLFAEAVERHALASPACHEEHGVNGLALEGPRGQEEMKP